MKLEMMSFTVNSANHGMNKGWVSRKIDLNHVEFAEPGDFPGQTTITMVSGNILAIKISFEEFSSLWS